jgi:hypothetical protein
MLLLPKGAVAGAGGAAADAPNAEAAPKLLNVVATSAPAPPGKNEKAVVDVADADAGAGAARALAPPTPPAAAPNTKAAGAALPLVASVCRCLLAACEGGAPTDDELDGECIVAVVVVVVVTFDDDDERCSWWHEFRTYSVTSSRAEWASTPTPTPTFPFLVDLSRTLLANPRFRVGRPPFAAAAAAAGGGTPNSGCGDEAGFTAALRDPAFLVGAPANNEEGALVLAAGAGAGAGACDAAPK